MTAQKQYQQKKNEIQKQINTLKQLLEQHDPKNAEAVHFGHVGDLSKVTVSLDELIHSLKR